MQLDTKTKTQVVPPEHLKKIKTNGLEWSSQIKQYPRAGAVPYRSFCNTASFFFVNKWPYVMFLFDVVVLIMFFFFFILNMNI